MGKMGILTAICLVLGVSAPAAALDLQEGMHGMRWNRPASEFDHLTQVRNSDPVAYYINSNTLYQVADEAVPAVVYGFYRNKFFAAYIKLGSPLQFNNLKRHFSGRYGPPKVEHRTAAQLTILRWKVSDINIKLKMKESGRDGKMAVYYLPLASELTLTQLEPTRPDLYPSEILQGNKSPKPLPLLE